nr:hypothetical protein [Phycisphaerae bacterium]
MIALTGLVCSLLMAGQGETASAIQSWLSREHARVVWQIGQFDGRSAEFGLALDQAQQFARRFGEKVTFEVGRNPPGDFPFIHPSEKDISWGGRPVIPFTIRFAMPEDAKGPHVLLLALTDTHEQLASTIEVALNGGKVWKQRMPLGRGRAFYGDPQGTPRLFLVPLPTAQLRRGTSELVLTLRGGSWVSYDGLALLAWPRAAWDPPAPTEVPAGVRTIAPDQFTAENGLAIPEQDGLRAVLLPEGVLVSEGLALTAAFYLEFAIRPQSGKSVISH